MMSEKSLYDSHLGLSARQKELMSYLWQQFGIDEHGKTQRLILTSESILIEAISKSLAASKLTYDNNPYDCLYDLVRKEYLDFIGAKWPQRLIIRQPLESLDKFSVRVNAAQRMSNQLAKAGASFIKTEEAQQILDKSRKLNQRLDKISMGDKKRDELHAQLFKVRIELLARATVKLKDFIDLLDSPPAMKL